MIGTETEVHVPAKSTVSWVGDPMDKTPLTRPVVVPFDMMLRINPRLLPYPERLTVDLERQVTEAVDEIAEADRLDAAAHEPGCDCGGRPAEIGGAEHRVGCSSLLPTTYSVETQVLLAVLDGSLDKADELIASLPESGRRSLRRAAGIVRYLATS